LKLTATLGQHKGQLQGLLAFVVTALTILVVFVFGAIMLGKLGNMNETQFGNNSNATAAVNAGFDVWSLTQSTAGLVLTIGFLLVALFVIISFLSKGSKRRGR